MIAKTSWKIHGNSDMGRFCVIAHTNADRDGYHSAHTCPIH